MQRVDLVWAHECTATHPLDLTPVEQIVDLVFAQARLARIAEGERWCKFDDHHISS